MAKINPSQAIEGAEIEDFPAYLGERNPPVGAERGLPSLLDQVPAIIWITDCDLRIIAVTGGALADHPACRVLIVGRTVTDALGIAEGDEPWRVLTNARAGKVGGYEFTAFGRALRTRAQPYRNTNGKIVGVVCATIDFTDECCVGSPEHTPQSLANLGRLAQFGTWARDLRTGEVQWSDQLYAIFGCDPQRPPLSPAEFQQFIHPGDRERVQTLYSHAFASYESFAAEFRIIRPDGEVRWVHHQFELEFDERGEAVRTFGTDLDVTERAQMQQQLAFAAFHDELTGLANRAFLMDRLNELVANKCRGSHSWALLLLDLDRFKVINESLGHTVGDLLLVEIARRLGRYLRSGDTLVRLGGDEFVILLEDIEDVQAACDVARRVLSGFAVPFTVAGRGLFASASIGVATSLSGDDRPADVLRNADIAMYRAKVLGKQRYALFMPGMLTSAISRLEMETDLMHAIERGEFRLFYQPILSAREGRLTGFEALLRWDHPGRGIVGPNEFISVAEENGAIAAIGEWVLGEACRQMQAWRKASAAGNDLRMNVNVSAKQLALPDFAQMVQSVLVASGLDSNGLTVEITESALMSNADLARATLAELRQIGVHIHLDDFGTGYSSLAYLHDFPIDALKIDRSFVGYSNPGVGLANIEIVRMIIALAQSLSLTVTAEGVETDEQHEQLRTLGCTNAQGFLFSRPVDALEAGAMIATYGSVADV